MHQQELIIKNKTMAKIQKFGSFLSGMVMPNIGAFIAWGIVTALFIPTGWFPNPFFNKLVSPTITYLLPLLIGYTGGYNMYGRRGAVVAGVAVMGIIVGTTVPMFLGAMIMGPFAAWVIKKFDQLIEGKIKLGFEMLVNNFSAGIIGGALMLLSIWMIGPSILALNNLIATGVNIIIKAGLIPLASIFVTPAQVLFLNNAVNHGILVPLGIQQAAKTGRSILFLVEANNGPMVGVLLAYWFYGRGIAKETASGNIIIVLFGGIGEVYFPYILMNPILVIAPILGSMSALTVWSYFKAGLVAAPSPGSIFAVLAMTPKGYFGSIMFGFSVGIVVAFVVASFILKLQSHYSMEGANDNTSLKKATDKMEELKGEKSKYINPTIDKALKSKVTKIVFACDAGMGSSAMGASLLNDKMKKAGIDIPVINSSINEIPEDADIIITHRELSERAKQKVPGAWHISVDNFLNSPEYDNLINELKGKNKYN